MAINAQSALFASTLQVQDPCVETLLAEEHFPSLTTDMAAPAVGYSLGSCFTPCPRENQWKRVGDTKGRQGRQREILHPLPSCLELRLENSFTVLSPDSCPD